MIYLDIVINMTLGVVYAALTVVELTKVKVDSAKADLEAKNDPLQVTGCGVCKRSVRVGKVNGHFSAHKTAGEKLLLIFDSGGDSASIDP